MEIKHTPTPWMVDGRPSYLVEQDDTTKKWSVVAHGKTICRLGTTDEDRANAAFIVRACNAHEDLLRFVHDVAFSGTGLVDLVRSARALHAKVEGK